MRFSLLRGFMVAIALAIVPLAGAQHYPTKPIRFIIPTAPSGGADVLARALGDKLSESLGQALVYDNRAGAGGGIGSELAAKSAADGYTILIVTSAHAVNPNLYAKLPYDAEKDFAPVALVGEVSYVISAHPSVPVKSLKDLIAYAKAHPRKLNYGSAGNGSSNHMAMEYFKMVAGIDLAHVPYKGGAPATTALLAGEVQVNFSSPPHVIGHIRAKRLTPLGVTSPRRLPPLPDVPTIAEQGFPNYRDSGWYAILVPAGTPDSIVKKLNAELIRIVAMPDVKAFYEKRGLELPDDMTTQHLGTLISGEIARFGKVVKVAGIELR